MVFTAKKEGKFYKVPDFDLLLVKEKSRELEVKKIENSEDAIIIAKEVLKNSPCEKLMVILLNQKNIVIGTSIVSVGNLTSSIVGIREIFQRALLSNSARIIMAHNHPANDPKPSKEDILATKKVAEAGEIMGIPLLDSLIITEGQSVSLKKLNYF